MAEGLPVPKEAPLVITEVTVRFRIVTADEALPVISLEEHVGHFRMSAGELGKALRGVASLPDIELYHRYVRV